MKTRTPTSWFKREAAIMIITPVILFALGLVMAVFGPFLLRLTQ